ncbi:MAG: hypothetical protein II387_03955 [Oscillospiraceae bacterium]|nr:hypothetical protein [Oscillospiraceae bacterium]
MKDQILSTTLASGLPLEINFSSGRGQEDDAVLLVADIADYPEHSYKFRMQEPDGREYELCECGRDAVNVVLEYFNDWFRQYILDHAARETGSVAGEDWILNLPEIDPDWTEED